jgi:hypothetical protein
MKLNAAILMATLMLSGTVLAQSSAPSAGGSAEGGQAGKLTTGQAMKGTKTADDAARSSRPNAAADDNTVGVNRSSKSDRRNEHYP